MNSSPAFQFYPGDWLSCEKISMMPPECEGAYIRLLAYAWKSEDFSLPADGSAIAQLSRLGEKWESIGVKYVLPCFVQKGDRLYNTRLLEERNKLLAYRKERSASGLKGAKSKWLSHQRAISSAIKEPMAKNGSSSSSSSSILTHTDSRWTQPLGVLRSSGKMDSLTEEALGQLNQEYPDILIQPGICEAIRIEACTVVGNINSPVVWLRKKLSDLEYKAQTPRARPTPKAEKSGAIDCNER